jgi:hypothetical protein
VESGDLSAAGAYSVEFWYLDVGAFLTVVAVLSFVAAIVGTRRGTYDRKSTAVILLQFVAMYIVIEAASPWKMAHSRNRNFASAVEEYADRWYGIHQRFPSDSTEFYEDVPAGAPDGRSVSAPVGLSSYRKNGTALPYEIVFSSGAAGPRVDHPSDRPGVLYYNVSSDRRKIWITMTGLDTCVSTAAVIQGDPIDIADIVESSEGKRHW